MNQPIIKESSSGLQTKSKQAMYFAMLVVWFVFLCFGPNMGLLRAPNWSVELTERVTGLSEPRARAIASIVLQSTGLILLGGLVALSRCAQPMRLAAPTAIVGAPLLGIASLWINYGYFPLVGTIVIATLCSVFGALVGLSFRKSRVVVLATLLFSGGIFVWGASTGISDDLYHLASMTGDHVLREAEAAVGEQDPFQATMKLAFDFASKNSQSGDPIFENKAAIVAMGVILGEERVAEVARRPVELNRTAEFNRLRQRMTLRGRHDLVRHFWVSAALTVLSGDESSMSVGIAKELMDAEPGGSGFSFVDLMADRCGIRMALAATRDADSARVFQEKVSAGLAGDELLPPINDLPEGVPLVEFEEQYGGLRGAETERIVQDIRDRINACEALR